MYELEPFAYFINHASAIEGLGGDSLSPDPRYCFHTLYKDVRPGPALFELQLSQVRASRGELALRIHAFRPGTGENATLVAGARLDLTATEVELLSTTVRFVALRNVQYAFYGFFIEDSDLHAEHLKILLHEFEGAVEDYIEPPRSLLVQERVGREVRPANALIHVVTPHLVAPVSQDCTIQQIEELASTRYAAANLTDWAEVLCLNALQYYGVLQPALEGIVVGNCSESFIKALVERRFYVQRKDAAPVPLANEALFGDFLLWPEGLACEPDHEKRWIAVKAWLGRLKIGGVGVTTFRYRPSDRPSSSGFATEGPEITKNEIGKWALRLIADGYSVAPLAFSSREDIVVDSAGLARFALVVQRM